MLSNYVACPATTNPHKCFIRTTTYIYIYYIYIESLLSRTEVQVQNRIENNFRWRYISANRLTTSHLSKPIHLTTTIDSSRFLCFSRIFHDFLQQPRHLNGCGTMLKGTCAAARTMTVGYSPNQWPNHRCRGQDGQGIHDLASGCSWISEETVNGC